MKKSGIFLLFLFLGGISYKNSFAQHKLTEFNVSLPRPTEVYSATDSLGSSAYIFQSNKYYEVNFLDSEFNVQRTTVYEKVQGDKNQKIIGAILDKDYCTAYFFNKKIKAFSSLSINRSTGECDFSRFHVCNVNEQFLRAFEMKGKFYVMIVPKNNDVVKLMVLKGSKMEEMTFDIPMPGFYVKLSKENDFMNEGAESEVGIEKISYQLGNTIESSHSRKKLYRYDNKIYFSFDEPYMTHLVMIDPVTQKTIYKKLNFNLEKGNNSSEKQGNSFMYKNRLFRTTMSPEQLNISILDLDSMDLKHTYNFYPGDNINILNTPILQKEAGSSNPGPLKTTDLFSRTLSGNLVIAVNEIDSNKYEIQLGSYEYYTAFTGPAYSAFGMPGISMGMGSGIGLGMGGRSYPYGARGGFYSGGFPGYYSNQTSIKLRITYFKSLLDHKDFSHVEGNVPRNVKEKIGEYESKLFRAGTPHLTRVSLYKDNLHLGYYSATIKRFSLIEFKK